MIRQPFGVCFARKLDVFEVAGIPERVEVAFQGGRVVNVSSFGKNAGADRVGGNAPVPVTLISEITSVCPHAELATTTSKQGQDGAESADAPANCPPKPLK